MFLHPRRICRKYGKRLENWFFNTMFRIKCKYTHVSVTIGKGSVVKGCTVKTNINGYISIGEDCDIRSVVFRFFGEGAKLILLDRIVINAHSDSKVFLNAKGMTKITIGSGCLFSNTIDISTTDWHQVLDENGERVNLDRDVYIGSHVWIGRKVMIGKGVSIGDNSIIGSGSVVTNSFDESNVVIAGNPARVCKRGISWKR